MGEKGEADFMKREAAVEMVSREKLKKITVV